MVYNDYQNPKRHQSLTGLRSDKTGIKSMFCLCCSLSFIKSGQFPQKTPTDHPRYPIPVRSHAHLYLSHLPRLSTAMTLMVICVLNMNTLTFNRNQTSQYQKHGLIQRRQQTFYESLLSFPLYLAKVFKERASAVTYK